LGEHDRRLDLGLVLKLDGPLSHGNTTELSHVTFYTRAAMETLLEQDVQVC
jgi:hypothetical protein